jgi:hypothetical protein
MTWQTVTSSGNGRRNDDLARVFEHGFEHGSVIDLLLLDGATSLAERDYADPVDGDPAWFVRCFADAFADLVAKVPFEGEVQAACVQAALAHAREAWDVATAGQDVPLYAWPIAALSWVRILPDSAGGVTIDSWCLGDCKLLLGLRDGSVRDLDPYANDYEHGLQQAVASMAAEGVLDAAGRFAALTPLLRARREEQMEATAPEVLCLAPRGPFAARCGSLHLDQDAARGAWLLAMSDGYYRLVDPYALYDDAGLMRVCAAAGPQGLLAELRRFEAGRDTSLSSVKGADDATAVAIGVGIGLHNDAKLALVQRYIAAYNDFDVDGMLATLHDDVRFENYVGELLTASSEGIAAFRTLAEQGRDMFAEREQRITGVERAHGVLIASIAWRGRPARDIPDGPRAGALLELAGRSEFSIADGRIVRIVDRS